MSRIVVAARPGDDPDSPLDLGETARLPRCDQIDLLMGRLIRLEAEIRGAKLRIARRARELTEMMETTHNPEVVASRAAGLAEDGALYLTREAQRRQTQTWLGELGIEDWR